MVNENLDGETEESTDENIYSVAPSKEKKLEMLPLAKPFLLLAGISGVGKTRFVREQANASRKDLSNYCFIPVRPDWHEPSDLLGYITRLGPNGACYIATDFLRFLVEAWKDAATSASAEKIQCKECSEMTPFWLCLDEMNLAPVEQYFADYLAVLETREWMENGYRCDPLFKAGVLPQLSSYGIDSFWKGLGLKGNNPLYNGLREYFSAENRGIPIPPNLIVAGTINMDETTHGLSRKVIDRALTIDFGEFYPNDFTAFFEPKTKAVILGHSTSVLAHKKDLEGVVSDLTGEKTIGFLESVNEILVQTPFELAFRALNEAFLLVISFSPENKAELQATWDDFLMMKVLPRIEGDGDTLAFDGEKSLLTELRDLLKDQFAEIWSKGRKDFLRESVTGERIEFIECRCKRKINWMQDRLERNGFTSFWP